jgi:hypothetical protein
LVEPGSLSPAVWRTYVVERLDQATGGWRPVRRYGSERKASEALDALTADGGVPAGELRIRRVRSPRSAPIAALAVALVVGVILVVAYVVGFD